MRTMKSALDHNVNTDIGAESSTWMIEFAGVLINQYLVGKGRQDGIRAVERRSLRGDGQWLRRDRHVQASATS